MTDGLKSDAVSFSLGGLEYATFFADDSVIGVFNLNQCQTVAMQIRSLIQVLPLLKA